MTSFRLLDRDVIINGKGYVLETILLGEKLKKNEQKVAFINAFH